MEIRRMHELVEQTTQVLQQARNELIALNQRQRSDSTASTEAPMRPKRGLKSRGEGEEEGVGGLQAHRPAAVESGSGLGERGRHVPEAH